MSVEGSNSSTFFDPISLEEVQNDLSIKIGFDTFNIHTLLDWMANDTDFGIYFNSVGQVTNSKFINPVTMKTFSNTEIKHIYDFGKKKGILSNKYSVFNSSKNKKLFLQNEIKGLNVVTSTSYELIKKFIIDLQNYVNFLQNEIPKAEDRRTNGEKFSVNKSCITRTINKFNKEYPIDEIDCYDFNEDDKTTFTSLMENVDKLLKIRSKW